MARVHRRAADILNTNTAVYIGIVYTYLPFMVLPIYATLEKMDAALLEAAEDLGCSRFRLSGWSPIPLSKAGVIAGRFLVFIPTWASLSSRRFSAARRR